jgi:endonuclease/exonuclease/phosphatase family metal-dependent hydrolase
MRVRWRRARAVCGWTLVSILLASGVRAEKISLATYNVENYVVSDRMVDGVYHRGYPKPEAEKTALRTVIRVMNADIVAMQEIGTLPYLKELQRDLANEGCDYPYAELLEGSDADRHVAVLSRRKFTAVKKHTDLSFTYFKSPETVKRGLLELHLKVGAEEITVFVVHLKSRFTDRSDDPMSGIRRGGEATAVRDRILSEFPEPEAASFLVLGDFNDVPKSRPLQAMMRKGKLTIAEPLAAADSRGEVWTHYYRKEESYSRIDYVLVSPGLKDAVVDGYAKVIDLPETLIASDHRPVMVTVEIK